MNAPLIAILLASAPVPQEPPPLPFGEEISFKVPPPANWEDPERLFNRIRKMMSPEEYLNALEKTGMQAHLSNENLQVGPGWVLEGPIGEFNDYNGRISQMKITNTAGYTVYAGTCGGGLWTWNHDEAVSADGEIVWHSIGDSLPCPNVRAFDVDLADEDHILVGTGEAIRYMGAGMFVTTNGGGQWSPVTLPPGVSTPDWFAKIEFCPLDNSQVLAAGSAGLWHSPDGGITWTVVLTNICYDFVWDPTDADLAYAISENSATDRVWRTPDGGVTWNPLPALPVGGFDNGRLAICRDQPGTVAVVTVDDALPANIGFNINSVALSTNANTAVAGNVTWANIANVTAGNNNDPLDIGGQAFHALAISIKPDDANSIFVGAGGMATTTDGGATWQTQGAGLLDYTHADFTSFYFSGQWDDIVWVCNDGGMFWDDLSGNGNARQVQGGPETGIAISQVDYSDADREMIGIGLQDNGVLYQIGEEGDPLYVPWTMASPSESDGTEVTIADAETGAFWYCDGFYSFDGDGDGNPDRPWRVFINGATNTDTNNVDPGFWGVRMYHDVWSSVMYAFAGVNVTSIPMTNIAAGWSTVVAAPTGNQVNDIWGSLVDGNTLFVTYRTGFGNFTEMRHLSVCRRSGNNWNVTTTNNLAPVNGWVLSVTPSYRWSDECWVTMAGPPGSAKILHMLPDGTTEDITGNLSALNVVHSVAVTPFNSDVLYAATDIGVFQTLDGGVTWTPFMTDLPVCLCRELQWVANDSGGWNHELVVATFGRGVFSRTISAPPLIYVNEDANGSEDGSFEHPYQTLTAAIDAAPSGAIIAIHADTYSEPQTITKNVRLETWAGQTVIR